MAETPILRIPQVSPSQSNKETTINDGFAIMERSLNDNRSIDLSAGDVEVNVQDYTRAFLFRCFGHTVARELTVPASTRFFTVFNDGTANVTVKAKDSAGMTAVCPQGSYCVIFNDGTDIILISDSAASGQVSAFLSLPDTPATFDGQQGQAVVVNASEDGLEFGTIAVSFTQLTDTPANYSGGQAGRVVRVNSGASGLEFADYISQFSQLSDTPSDYISQAGRMMVVNPNENGLMFTDVPEPVIMATRVFDIPNGAFEEGDFTNWIIPTTSFPEWVIGTGYFALEPVAGINFAIFAVEQGTDPNAIAYELDLLDVAYAEEIDDEAEIVVDIAMGSMTEDYGSIEIEFLDEADQFIDSTTSPQYVGTDEMTDRRFRTEIPEGARKVIVYLHIEKNTESSFDPDNLSFAFDHLRVELKLVVDQISTLIQLLDTPLSYEGNAGKVLVVNGEENAMEFQDTPGVRDYFYQLLDTPANYDGATGRYVRVNSGGDGLVFEVPQFTQLGDTPANFGGQSGRYLRVNTGETALEFVADTGGVETLEDLDDVAYPDPPEDGWVLTYDNGVWIAAEPTGGSGPGGGAESLEDLDDVAFPDPPEDGWVLTYDDGFWIAAAPTGGGGSAEYPSLTGNAGRVLAVNSNEDDVEWVVQSGGLAIDTFGVSFSSTGTPDSEQIVWTFISPGVWSLPVDFAGSIFYAGVPPADDVTFNITKNGTVVGTATFAQSSDTAVFDVATPVSFAAGDRLQLVSPDDVQDIADLAATFIGLAGV